MKKQLRIVNYALEKAGHYGFAGLALYELAAEHFIIAFGALAISFILGKVASSLFKEMENEEAE